MGISCLVLDCDGTLLQSVDIKADAFSTLAMPYGEEARQSLVMYHRLHGGVSRREKFSWFFRKFVNREMTDDDFHKLDEQFEQLCVEAIADCPMVLGAEAVLNAWHDKMSIYVCSGAPHAELWRILRMRGIDGYFTGIYGTPPGKTALLHRIVREGHFAPEDVLMVGDSFTDLDAAEAVGTQFYGIGDDFMSGIHPGGEDLQELNAWLEEHLDPTVLAKRT